MYFFFVMTYIYTYPRPMFRINRLFSAITPSRQARRNVPTLSANDPIHVPKKYRSATPKTRKEKISAALREQVWIQKAGRLFEKKCNIIWCENNITAFDFQCGHNIPESKGGGTTLENLIPICSRCNLSMSDKYSIDEWNALYKPLHVSIIPPIKPSPNLSDPLPFISSDTSLHCNCFPWRLW